jgi:predicted transcriptional regulator
VPESLFFPSGIAGARIRFPQQAAFSAKIENLVAVFLDFSISPLFTRALVAVYTALRL